LEEFYDLAVQLIAGFKQLDVAFGLSGFIVDGFPDACDGLGVGSGGHQVNKKKKTTVFHDYWWLLSYG
jgi:hypothetical protein